MVSATTKIVNPMGMHMRPAQLFVNTASKFQSDITILYQGNRINAKSIMHLMAACLKQGSELEIECQGPDEAEALAQTVALIESGLGE